jgi:hypothetical protein
MPALGSVTSDQVAVGGMVVVVAFEGLVVVDCLGRVVVRVSAPPTTLARRSC